jgi:hypothetical protein
VADIWSEEGVEVALNEELWLREKDVEWAAARYLPGCKGKGD